MPMVGTRGAMSVRGFGFGGSSGVEMTLVSVSVGTAANSPSPLPTSPNAPQAGDFCFVYSSDNGSDPGIGASGGIVGWTGPQISPNIGLYGYAKRLSAGDIVTNSISFASVGVEGIVIFVFRLAIATTVVTKGVAGAASATNPQALAGFALGASAKAIVLFGCGSNGAATLASPVLPAANTSAPVNNRNVSARWGRPSLYVSSANLSYIPAVPGTPIDVIKWELD